MKGQAAVLPAELSEHQHISTCFWVSQHIHGAAGFTYRFEAVQDGHHDVASVVPLQVEQVDRTDDPQVDARQARQHGQLEADGEVGLVRVERRVEILQENQRSGFSDAGSGGTSRLSEPDKPDPEPRSSL